MEAIFGIVNFSQNNRVSHEELKRMGQVLDAHSRLSFYVNGNVGFAGINNPAINNIPEDLLVLDKDRNILGIFIGELHNYKELEAGLRQNNAFRTKGKAEFVIRLYKEYGNEFIKKLNGLFTCAIWDAEAEKLILGIDRFSGIRRMQYALLNDCLIFGSEIKTILANHKVPRDIDYQALNDYLTIGYIYGYHTAFQHIKRLPPAHILTVEVKKNETQLKRYWDIQFPLHHQNGKPEYIFDIYKKATARRLEGLNPVSAYLSGGLDSSTNVAMLRQLIAGDIYSFSVGFQDKRIDESPYAEIVARALNTNHKKTLFNQEVALRLPEMVWFLEEPFCDGSFVPTFLLCKLTKEYTDIVISGDGPDHLFGRYSWLANNASVFELLPFSRSIKRCLDSRESSNPFLCGLARLGRFSHLPMKQAHTSCYTSCLTENLKKQLYTADFQKMIVSQADENIDFGIYPYGKTHKINELIYADILINGTFAVFNKMGRMAQANSLIVREPFLDNELVDYINTLPVGLKHSNGVLNTLRGKKVNKVAMRRYIAERLLPQEVLAKKKQGFMLPANFWLKDELFATVKQIVLSPKAKKRGYFNNAFLEEIFTRYPQDKEIYGGIIFLLLVLELWHLIFIDNKDMVRPDFDLSNINDWNAYVYE